MTTNKKSAAEKRTNLPRDAKKTSDFVKDWEKISRSGKHDLNSVKEAMMLLIANDAPLPAEWRDHKLKGRYDGTRECHVKGDLLLVYQVYDDDDGGLVTFLNTGTHSEIFG